MRCQSHDFPKQFKLDLSLSPPLSFPHKYQELSFPLCIDKGTSFFGPCFPQHPALSIIVKRMQLRQVSQTISSQLHLLYKFTFIVSISENSIARVLSRYLTLESSFIIPMKSPKSLHIRTYIHSLKGEVDEDNARWNK